MALGRGWRLAVCVSRDSSAASFFIFEQACKEVGGRAVVTASLYAKHTVQIGHALEECGSVFLELAEHQDVFEARMVKLMVFKIDGDFGPDEELVGSVLPGVVIAI